MFDSMYNYKNYLKTNTFDANQYTPAFMPTPSCFGYAPFGAEAQVNVAFILSLVYVVCYVIMEPLAGSIGAALVTAIYLYSGHLVCSDLGIIDN